MKGRDELLSIAEDGVKRALAEGADAAEVYAYHADSVTFSASGAFVESSERSDAGFGVRVMVGGRLGVAGSTSLSRMGPTLRAGIDAARRSGVAAGAFRFLAPSGSLPAPRPAHPALESLDPDRMSGAAERISRALLAVPDVTYGDTRMRSWRHQVAIANSEGMRAYDRSIGEKVEFELRLTRGATDRSATEVWTGSAPIEETLDVEAYVARTAQRAIDALDARPLEGGPVDTVIFAPVPATQVLGILGGAFSGRGASSGISPLVGRVGQRIFSERVTLRDLPHGPGANPRALDDEGTPTVPRALVERGVLAELLHDAQSAAEHGVVPTGHAQRAGATGMVSIRPHNVALEAGEGSPAALIEQADRAILVNEAMLGAFTANMMTGDFSASVPFAFLVERGVIRHALPPTTIGGNVHEVLKTVQAVANDVHSGRAAMSPSILARGVSCAT